jgi:hypothetical protein
VSVHSLDSPQVLKYPLRLRYDLGCPLNINSAGQPVGVNMMQVSAINGVAFASPQPGEPMRLDRYELVPDGPVWTTRRTTLFVYTGLPDEGFTTCVLSPHKDRLAWMARTRSGTRFFVTRIDGHGIHLVFDMPNGWPVTEIEWMPDGKHLCFSCGVRLFMVPV